MDLNGNTIYAVDFDGTLSLGVPWPEIGRPNKTLFEALIREKAEGARMILFTCRNGEHLKAAVDFCRAQGLEFDTVNANLPELIEAYGGDTRKINADVYLDDKAINPIAPVARFKAYADVKAEKDAAEWADQPTLKETAEKPGVLPELLAPAT